VSDPEGFSPYITRAAEQRQIAEEVAKVKATRRSRAVLLYGPGGTGKTRLVRHLAQMPPELPTDQRVIWLPPVDVDDSQHWLLSNLERHVAGQLDPDGNYFRPFLDYVSELPRHGRTPPSREAVLSHLNRIKAIFAQCYKEYIEETGNSVVMTFDTIEAVRGVYLLRVLTRWMKDLPGTLFILAGRSPSGSGGQDPIGAALEEPPMGMPVTVISLGEFNEQDCRAYLAPISENRLSEEETEKLVYLTQGNPLWLAFAVDYLTREGLPPETRTSLDEIKRDLPYHGAATAAGRERIESFKTHLVAPYRAADFWHDAINRLASVRESVSQPIWQRLMTDRQLPAGIADFDQAWETLRATEWIRPRANSRYITLHDAVAEELAQRVISMHDYDGRRRRQLWRIAAGLYADQVSELQTQLAEKQPEVERRLRALGPSERDGHDDEAAVIRAVAELDSLRQELNQLMAAHLFYQLLSDFRAGSQLFVRLLRLAGNDHDVLFEDLLAFQMQRFLPGGADENTLRDTVGATINDFRKWLSEDGGDCYVDVGLEMAGYLIEREQHDAALNLLGQLPVPADHERRYRLHNLQANACLRIPGRVRESGEHFQAALAEAIQMPGLERHRRTADAHKELGFYYRNIGHWRNADEAYKEARDAIRKVPLPENTEADLEQKASINTNWAYLKGVGGRYGAGINLVESAITLRGRLGRHHQQAISWSVKGEVHRYNRQFKEAWEAYAKAEQLFREQSSWSWLGVVYQEQAICLFQSIPAGVQLLAPPLDPGKEAESLIERSLRLCRELNVRAYPSALNRAGRIFAPKDPDQGLSYLEAGAKRAQELSDGWFWMANLIEYAELNYLTWSATGETRYRENIDEMADRLREAEEAQLEFPELRGRWNILQGHLILREALASGSTDGLDAALENYRIGFPLITYGWVGSYGASAAIPGEFKKFRDLVWQLPAQTRAHWQQELYLSWSSQEESVTQLLARLEELY
jgi:tetratricopeptide (TPR) repeat protein